MVLVLRRNLMPEVRLIARHAAVGICLGCCSLLLLAGCHGAPNGSQSSGAGSAPMAIVQGPQLSRASLRGGPMPPAAAAIFREKMAAVAQQSVAAHSHAAPTAPK